MLEVLESIPITVKISKEAEIRWFLKSLPTLVSNKEPEKISWAVER